MAVLLAFAALLSGCQSLRPAAADPTRAQMYASVLRALARDSSARWVVVESLVPATDFDTELDEKVFAELHISRRDLNAFHNVQRAPRERFHAAMIPDSRWTAISLQRIDSLRERARQDITAGVAARGANNDLFWRRWSAAYPGASGYVLLSPASVSRDGTNAVVRVSIVCGPVCAESELQHVQRGADGVWRTTARVRLSES